MNAGGAGHARRHAASLLATAVVLFSCPGLVAQEPAAPRSDSGPSTAAPALPALAVLDSGPVVRLSLAEFLAQVGRLNLDYAAQAFNVSIGQAEVSVAHVFPNPTLSWGSTFDVSGQRQATTYDVALTQEILLGGKRGARTDAARWQLAAARAQLDDFLRTLRGTAADAYVDAVHAERVYARKRRATEDLDRLVGVNARRVAVGDIGEIDLVQSRVDAAQAEADLVGAANDVRTTRLALTGLLTSRKVDTLVAPAPRTELVPFVTTGPDLPVTPALLTPQSVPSGTGTAIPSLPALDVDSLTAASLASRPDLLAAHRLLDAAQAGIRVAHGDRWPDVDLSFGGSYFTLGTSVIDPTPIFSALTVGVSFPLPFSNFTHGELDAARYTAAQAATVLQSTEWKVTIEVRQAWASLQAARAQITRYTSGVLADAERVRRAKLYSYEHGSASLLDVLTAEQTANTVYLSSYDAQQSYMHALIALSQATGAWSLVLDTAGASPSPN